MANRVRYFLPIEEIEKQAFDQIQRTASMPFVHGLAVMPDAHWGKGSTVGTVVATVDAVMPACVGVDIGCGMNAVCTNFTWAEVKARRREIREAIEKRIPVGIGDNGCNTEITASAEARIVHLEHLSAALFGGRPDYMNCRSGDWKRQIGSLGGGNHFIELCVGGRPYDFAEPYDEGHVWATLHSGSRGVGNRTGKHWTEIAQRMPKHYMNGVDLPDRDLAALLVGWDEYRGFIDELFWCQQYALLNRQEMMERILDVLARAIDGVPWSEVEPQRLAMPAINCHHNFVAIEEYDGQSLHITRKGAVRARVGDEAMIPGSMGTRSYIVHGRGNAESFNSAPHGAGRRMSRGEARRTFTVDDLTKKMEGLDIESRVRSAIVDEHPEAYKDIEQVIRYAEPLVRPVWTLRQVLNTKGD